MTGRSKHLVRLTALLLALSAFFVFGFLSGRVGRVGRGAGPSVLDEAATRISSEAAGAASREALERAAIEGMLASLGDKYASYYGEAQFADFQRALEGRYTGIGVWLARVGGQLQVTSVLPGSPAGNAGVLPGDEIVSLDGTPIADRSVSQVVTAMRGDVGTTLRIGVRRGANAQQVVVRRAAVQSNDVVVDHPDRDVTRIQVFAFTKGVGRQVRAAVQQARDRRVRGIVLDLRGNAGGLLHEAVETASAFLSDGLVVTYRGRGVADQRYDVVSGGNTDTTLVVLVDGGTASAAEVVAGALQDRDRAVIVGTRTYGKGSVQQPIKLADGTAIEITVARYYTPSGRSVDGVGIRPDIDVAPSVDSDVALDRAVDVLTGILADAGPPRG
ncbi:MAG: S41 family peptidase [Mycobacteriales bacterium]